VTRRTKIVATIGPASRDPEVLVQMVEAGMDVARLNFSHGTHEEHAETAQLVRQAAGRAGRAVAILQDLPGPKLRIGPLREGTVELKPGDVVTFVCGEGAEVEPGDERRMSISWAGLATAISPGEVLYLADGAVRLRVTETRPADGEVDAAVEIGGTVASRQGVNIPGPADELPSVPEEDLRHLDAGLKIGVDLVALSFVRKPEDITHVREHTRVPLIAKIEKPQAVARAEEIVRAADCIMVARGDLGIELPIEEVPMVQKRLLELAGALARPAITATQMLDSMVKSSRPTRAEVADVANAILDGTDAVMLSQETAVGAYPVGAIRMMASIAETTERHAPYERWNETRVHRDARDPAYTLAHAACEAARDLRLDALVIPTLSGRSARLVSAHRPTVPIYALSPGKETVRRCGLMWGVRAASMRRHEVTEELIADAARRVAELGWVEPGHRIGITAGLPSGKPGSTSLFQIQEVPHPDAPAPRRQRGGAGGGRARRASHSPPTAMTTSTTTATIVSGEPKSPKLPPSAV
jgi:pyruvate kinase